MARILASAAAGASATASTSLGPSWLFGLCVFVVSVWVVSFAVFLCGHSHDDDDHSKKKPAPAPDAARSGTVVDTSGMYAAAYVGSNAHGGCSGGHHHGGHHHYGGHHGGGASC